VITNTLIRTAACIALLQPPLLALGQLRYISTTPAPGSFPIAHNKSVAGVYVDPSDFPGVARAADNLRQDITRVTGLTAPQDLGARATIIAGTIGKNAIIDQLIRERKLNVTGIQGKWESFVIQVVPNPQRGIRSALVIAGSDKRGSIYGIYDVSEQIGVSPWYFWADVPVLHHDALFVKPGRYVEPEPAVKYRGIFLNDEAPALSGWVRATYGNYNHQFYEKVFELLLRLKANYLWPAMWNNAFSDDDPLNAKLADEYGIVMGTSHHEPMLRAQKEWTRHGTGPWDYSRNDRVLRTFWEQGVRRNKNYESIITLGMRGDGDLPMSREANTALLERIVADQRKIIAAEVNPDVTKIPQDWALYKEVQEYYEKGMRVPDDVTLLWCDDNWGNIRRLPTPEERKRSGGAGIYYHFDYVGDPRNYKWIDTNPIPKVWEQMHLALEYGANRIWIVNIGDLKPMEFPTEFFLNLARNPARWPKEKLREFTELWAAREFGPKHAAEIADLVSTTLKYNGRRKPELLEPETFSVINYQEADRVVADYDAIVSKAEAIERELPVEARDAFFELVLHPAKANAIVTSMYVAAAKNHLYAAQGRASANDMLARTEQLFREDAELSDYFNHTLAHGKWNHMMDQTHIGYTGWQEPPTNTLPPVTQLVLPAAASMGIAVEGSSDAWPGASPPAVLPSFDAFTQPRHFIDVFNRGIAPFEFTAAPTAPWIVLSTSRGSIEKEQRLWIGVDWGHAPTGSTKGAVTIEGAGTSTSPIAVEVDIFKPAQPSRASLKGFVETSGYVSIEAEHYSRKVDAGQVTWQRIPDYGRALSAMSIFPVTANSLLPPAQSPVLEYQMYLFDSGPVEVEAILSPTLNFQPGHGLRYAISFDAEPPQVIDALAHNTQRDWQTSVKDSVRKVRSKHVLAAPGVHTLKFWMVDPGIVLEKLVVEFGGVKPSYLGPPESFHR
jgi:hypothetical protein